MIYKIGTVGGDLHLSNVLLYAFDFKNLCFVPLCQLYFTSINKHTRLYFLQIKTKFNSGPQ